MASPSFSPKEFMKARRPERFSDSVVIESPTLDRSMLEYHLSTLTNRNQEILFEEFARKLAEREICPNLLPHTGPMGGGDSKVDTETYPVADALSLAWFVGEGREAASERWGFAFSAKEVWKPKVKSDIKKIAETGRIYIKAFFISNQFIRDKLRAEVEDKLSMDFNLDVRILDRNWILDKVFEGEHEDLAIDELGLQTSLRKQKKVGPLDLTRERELKKIEEKIKTTIVQPSSGVVLVDDCIEAALLARSLELPRTEIEGKFVRAEQVAEKFGSDHQQLSSVYQRAWTAFWWFEDYQLFTKLYFKAEDLASCSNNPYDLELLTNLWFILESSIHRKFIDEEIVELEKRTTLLQSALGEISRERNRPSASLHAKTLLLQIQLIKSFPDKVDSVFRDLKKVIEQCEGLVGYSFESLSQMVVEFGDVISDQLEYEELFNLVVDVTSRREGEVSAARMLVRRGAQQLDSQKPYEAIRILGRALGFLYKHESRNDMVHALYICGNAYHQVGLLWAARGTVLLAASISMHDFWAQNEITTFQAACCNRMKWLELSLGRLPHILAWHETDRAIANALISQEDIKAEDFYDYERMFDSIFALMPLKATIQQLKDLTFLPAVLDNLGLFFTSSTLLYALGQEEELPQELLTTLEDGESLHEFFSKWRDQPVAGDLPEKLHLHQGQYIELESSVLGCKIIAHCENESPCIELAESILAALESLLATSILSGIVPSEPFLTIDLREYDFAEKPFEFKILTGDDQPSIEIRCADFNPHSLSPHEQSTIKEKLFELLAWILGSIFMLSDPEQDLKRLYKDESAFDRSLHFTSSLVTLGNVLGDDPKTTLSAWRNNSAQDYPLVRSQEWDATERLQEPIAQEVISETPEYGIGVPPSELSDPERIKHTHIKYISLIRNVLWDQAGWKGIAYLVDYSQSVPPIFAPLFSNADAARKIISHWRRELGVRDKNELLHITIIRGISRSNPYAYRVVISTNLTSIMSPTEIQQFVIVSRIHTMDPDSDINIERFLESYNNQESYYLALGVLEEGCVDPKPIGEDYIEKRELHLKDAWQIGRNDPDSAGIFEDDDLIIPSDQENPPALELIKWRQQRSKGPE